MRQWNPDQNPDAYSLESRNGDQKINIPIIEEEKPRYVASNSPEFAEGTTHSPHEDKNKKRSNGFVKLIVITLIVSLVGGSAIGVGSTLVNKYFDGFKYENSFYLESNDAVTAEADLVVQQSGQKSVVQIADQVGPSVVAITSKVTVRDFFSTYQSEGAGSGVVFNINKDSVVILTNNHVIEGAEEVLVEFDEFSSSKAELVGVDQETDLAVIKVKREDVPVEIMGNLKPAVFGNSDTLEVGELAVAIGNPLGYNRTVTVGVVSALNRELQVSANKFTLIQTDAAINPGNSGGALVNGNGEVIGINTVKISDTQVEGIGFAIPINSAKPIVDQLLTNGYVSRPYLGVSGRNIDEQLSELYELPIGVYVARVIPNSAADDAGLEKGDVIISFDGQKLNDMEQLIELIKEHQVGDKIEVKLVRNGTDKVVKTVVLKEKNDSIQ